GAPPDERPAVADGGVGVRVSGGVGVGGLGEGQPGLVGVRVRSQAKRLADLLPVVPGLPGGADVLAGSMPGADLDVPGGTTACEWFQVADGQVGSVEHGAGEELGSAVAGQVDDRPVYGGGCLSPLFGAVGWMRHRGVLLR